MLASACRQVGVRRARNVATIGGNICNGAVSADSVIPLYALDSELVLVSRLGTRVVPIRAFHSSPGKTIRERDEILVQIRIPRCSYTSHSGSYIKFGQRKAMEIATLSCAVNVSLTADKRHLYTVAIAYGVAAPTPVLFKDGLFLTGGGDRPELFPKRTGKNVLRVNYNRVTAGAHPKNCVCNSIKELLRSRNFKEAIRCAGGEFD